MAKPVIGSDLGGIPELVENGKTGYLFKAGEANDLQVKIKALYNDLESCQKLGQNARQWAEKQAQPQLHLTEILQIYQNLV